MAVDSTDVSMDFTGLSVNVPVFFGVQVYDEVHIEMVWGLQDAVAVRGVDYSVALAVDFSSADITPLAPLFVKIANANNLVGGDNNLATVRRVVPYTSDFVETDGFLRRKIANEFDLVAMRIQQIAKESSDSAETLSTLTYDIDTIHTDRLAAEAAALEAEAAAAVLGNEIHQYDTRAQAIAATIPAGVNFLRLLGYATPGDCPGGAGLYRKLFAAPTVINVVKTMNNGSGAIRVFVPSVIGLTNGMTGVVIAGVGGSTAANGTWTIGSVANDNTGSHFDLVGSTFTTAYTSGGTVSGPTFERSWHIHNAVDGSWWELHELEVTPRMFGAVGDGVADDMRAFTDAGDYISTLRGGGVVYGISTDTYRCVVNYTVAWWGLVFFPNVDYTGRIAKIRIECNAYVYAGRFKASNIKFHGWDVKVSVSAGLSGLMNTEQKAYHSTLNLGTLLDDYGTISSLSPFLINNDIEIYDNLIDGVVNNGGGCFINGDGGGDNISIHDNTFASSNTVGVAIGLDWNFVGPLNEADLDASKAAHLAGTMYTVHYTRVSIKRNRIGNMFMPVANSPDILGGNGIRLSSVISFDISDNEIAGVFGCGIRIHGGDVGVEYVKDPIWRTNFANEWVIRNNQIKQIYYGDGIKIDCYGDNIYRASLDPGDPNYPYAPIYLSYYNNNMVIEGNLIRGDQDTASIGIYCLPMLGGTIRNNTITNMTRGVFVGPDAHKVMIIDGNRIYSNKQEGILVQNSSGVGSATPTNTLIARNYVYQNNRVGAVGDGNIRIDVAGDTIVCQNDIGHGDSTSNGIVNTANATRTVINDNIIHSVKSGGSAVKLAHPYTTVSCVSGNRLLGAGFAVSGMDLIPYSVAFRIDGGINRRFRSATGTLTGGVTPTSGTFTAGDRIEFDNPSAGGNWGSICTTGGVIGSGAVFKLMGGVAA
jgi:hypothetical protein